MSFCSIIPYSRSLDDMVLTYHIPRDLLSQISVGILVYIPWGDEEIIGIVADIRDTLAYDGDIKSITSIYCPIPLFSSQEISCIVSLAQRLCVRLHVIAQLFLSPALLASLDVDGFLQLPLPRNPQKKEESRYTIAPDEGSLQTHLFSILREKPGVVIFPDTLSARAGSESYPESVCIDASPRGGAQTRVYREILSGSSSNVFGTRRTFFRRLGAYERIYILHEHLAEDIYFGRRILPVWILADIFAEHGYTIHYITTTPSIRTLTHFLQTKKPIHYLS